MLITMVIMKGDGLRLDEVWRGHSQCGSGRQHSPLCSSLADSRMMNRKLAIVVSQHRNVNGTLKYLSKCMRKMYFAVHGALK